MGYVEQFAAARTNAFLQKCEMALVVAARDVIAEAKDIPNHYNRVVLATQVLRDPLTWTHAFKDAVAANAVDDTAVDGAFYSAVLFHWNGYAGITLNGALT